MVLKPSICTISLGRVAAGHSILHKLDVAASHGFKGIELFHEDILSLSSSIPGGSSLKNQLVVAGTIGRRCQQLGLIVLCLQPFMQYEGLLDRQQHQKRIAEMHHWVDMVHHLGTDLILIPSSNAYADQITQDMDLMTSDLQVIADIGSSANPPVRYAFEALCWGTRIDTWEASWDMVRRVNRTNFGLCLDTFNIAARIYADPTSPTGCTPDCQDAVRVSIARMFARIDIRKVFLLQVADGERLDSPLTERHEFYNPEQPARMSWSRNARLFYGEEDQNAYLPIRTLLNAIVNGLGYDGWMSFEVFNRALFDESETVPEVMAQRAIRSFHKMVHDLQQSPSARL